MSVQLLGSDVVALPGFVPDIDWAATVILLGVCAAAFIVVGAALAVLLVRYFSSPDRAPTPRQSEQSPSRSAYPLAPHPQSPQNQPMRHADPAWAAPRQQAPAPASAPSVHAPPTQTVPAGQAAVRGAPPGQAGPVDRVPVDDGLAAQRAALISGYVKVRGLLDDDVAVAVLNDAIRAGGATIFEATGMPVDPKRHRVDHTVPAPTAALDGVVFETLEPGYLDKGRVLRPATVVVYKWSA